ncbi:MAG: Uncharacterized protein G01um101449_14 [Parcubacteria group bacterium Gr01-1014_49]|nr:MAG: Uncharacterized protein G01um101449_14 [Parcubacteria group bacterium Gr01-1014_49]
MQANVEYWFRLLYECIHGACYGSTGFSELSAWLAHLWLWIIAIGYLLALLGLFVIIYATVRLFELREREREFYQTLILTPEAASEIHERWKHIETLVGGATASEWREAIIEADIMLDDVLAQQGYVGDGVGEKLKSVDPVRVTTLQDAWDAHKIRNQIAHEGSAFNLSDTLARRTIARYANVFREFKAI